MKSDDEWVRGIARGELGAFDALFSLHSPAALGYATRLLGGNIAKAEDVVQTVWEKVIRNIDEYRPEGKFRSWLFTLVRNASLDLLRAEQRQKWDSLSVEELEEKQALPASESFSESGVEAILDRQIEVSRMKAVIDELPARQRFVLTAWMTERMSPEELAKDLGISVKAVGALLVRAKRGLEKGLLEGVREEPKYT